jgi:hypothetical protein
MSKNRSNIARQLHRPDSLSSTLSRSFNRTLAAGHLQALDATKNTDFAALIVERASTSRAPTWTADAQSSDPAARRSARETYQRCLEIYRTAVRPQDTTHDDAGAALAFFVAINLNALHDLPTTPDVLLLLERQLLGLVRQISAWDSASIAQRQFYFEQIATLGVFVAGLMERARSEGAAALAKVQKTARGYLRHVLGMDPDLLTFGAHGLALRPAPGAAQAGPVAR